MVGRVAKWNVPRKESSAEGSEMFNARVSVAIAILLGRAIKAEVSRTYQNRAPLPKKRGRPPGKGSAKVAPSEPAPKRVAKTA